MTQRFTTGQAFAQGDQVTAQKLEDIVEKATPLTALTDDTSTTVSGGQIIVKTATGAANGITLPKIAHQPANTVLVRDANSEGEVSAKAVTDTQILIGDGTGFTAAALSGDVTMTNAGAVTIANDAVETAMIADDVGLGGNPTTTTQSAGNNTTRIATTAFATTAVKNGATAVFKTSGSVNDPSNRYFSSNISEVVDPYNIVSQSGGLFTFHEAGTYLVELVGKFKDSDLTNNDVYNLMFVNDLSSTSNLQDQSANFSENEFKSFSISIVRTISDASTDKLAVYVSPESSAAAASWDAQDCVFKITQLS